MNLAVVVPVYRASLSLDEQTSWLHLVRHLAKYQVVLLLPESLPSPDRRLREVRFPDSCFASVASYSRLLLSQGFYRAFEPFEFILVYQLDCLVFGRELSEFTAAGFDYLGAPWLADDARPERGFSRVGNGGLSLRRVAACLTVLSRGQERSLTRLGLRHLFTAAIPDHPRRLSVSSLRKRLRVLREVKLGAGWYTDHYTVNEDRFWSDRARLFDPDFQIAPPADGLRFAFECAPRHCFEANRRQLPFGCHAWARHDRDFWQPYLL